MKNREAEKTDFIRRTLELTEITYEDNHLLVVAKPSCVPTVPDAYRSYSLFDWCKEYLKRTRNKPGKVFLGVVHRLDRPVSGIVCFAVTSKAASRLTAQFRSREVEKTYLGLVRNRPPGSEGLLEHLLTKNRNRNIVTAYRTGEKGIAGKIARTQWRLLKKLDNAYLLEMKPETGRSHQLRVQLAAMGCPLAGDKKYGDTAARRYGLPVGLHALRLRLTHPTRKETMDFSAPIPETMPWTSYPELFTREIFPH